MSKKLTEEQRALARQKRVEQGRAWAKAHPKTEEQKARRNARAKAHRVEHLEEIKAQRIARRAANPERYRAVKRAWNAANAEAVKERRKSWYADNAKNVIARSKAYTEAHPGKAKANRLRREYGLTPGQYQAMSLAQGGLCAICLRKRKLVVDHNHSTGKVRALLCGHCNSMIGFCEESGARLRSAIRYLKQHNTMDAQPETLPLFAGVNA